jgi:hypothetical protein
MVLQRELLQWYRAEVTAVWAPVVVKWGGAWFASLYSAAAASAYWRDYAPAASWFACLALYAAAPGVAALFFPYAMLDSSKVQEMQLYVTLRV